MVARRLVQPLVVAWTILEADSVDQTPGPNLQGKSCQTTSADVPPVGNGLFQSKFQRQNLQPGAVPDASHNGTGDTTTVAVASFASVSRKSLSQQAQTLQVRKSAAGVQMGMERMEASWEDSVSEINNLIGSIIDHESSSEDSCSTQLLEYKNMLTTIHESTTSIAVEVNSTASQIAIFDKECKEKNEELNEIEVVDRKKITKCVTERSVQVKTLETLRYDMQEMRHVAQAHIHLQAGETASDRFPPRKYPSHALLETNQSSSAVGAVGSALQEPPSHERVANVKSMVQKTKDMASKVSTCMAKAKLAPQALLLEETTSPQQESDGTEFTETWHSANDTLAGSPPNWPKHECNDPQPRCFPVSCGSDGWVCGAIEQCSDGPRPMCHPLSCVQGQWQCGSVSGPEYSACDGKNRGDDCQYAQFEARIPRVARSSPPLVKGKCRMPAVNLAETEMEVYSFLQVDIDTSPYSGMKCVPDNAPTECKEIVVELEHQFTVSYVSLTRMIEEYEVVTHSTVCEETVHEAYVKQSSAVQDEANKVCSDVQVFISKLEKYKFEYQSSTKTETKMDTTIRTLVKQCGSLTSTETYLEDVQDTLGALGNCPGIGDVTFHLPTWVGEWVKFDQDRQKSDMWNDKQMAEVCSGHFGYGARPAEVSEIDSQSVQGMPAMNTAEFPVLGACPMCKGKRMPGLTSTGWGRVCWDGGAPFSRFGRRRDCGGGPRNVLCVFDGASVH